MVRTGIIGLGKMGISHCAILGAHPDVDLVSVCESSSIITEAFKKHTRFKCFSDYKLMIDTMELDALFVATPTKFHSEMVKYALDKNVHVFCEKPFSLNAKDGKLLSDLALKNNLVNQVGYHNRFIGTFNEMKRLYAKNLIGDLYHFTGESYGPVVVKEKATTWRTEKGQGGGCLYDYASHTIDLIHFILSKPVSVSGTHLKSIFSRDVEDAVYSLLTLENGLTGQLSVNWSDDTYRKMSTQISLFGKKGKLIADATELKIYLREPNEPSGLEKGWTVISNTNLTENPDFNLRGEEYSLQIDHFINAVKTRTTANRSSFTNAVVTDEVIDLLIADNQNN